MWVLLLNMSLQSFLQAQIDKLRAKFVQGLQNFKARFKQRKKILIFTAAWNIALWIFCYATHSFGPAIHFVSVVFMVMAYQGLARNGQQRNSFDDSPYSTRHPMYYAYTNRDQIGRPKSFFDGTSF